MTKNISLKSGFATALIFFLSLNFSYAHWTTKGPYGGSVSAFASKDTILFLASPTGGVYFATNTQYSTWKYVNFSGLGDGRITSLAVLGNHLIAGSLTGIYVSTNIDTVVSGLVSQPAIALWRASSNGLSNAQVISLAVSQNGKIFAGTDGGGVFMSADSGATWSAANSGLTTPVVTSFLTLGDTVMAGTAGGGSFLTLNAGGTWFAFSNGLSNQNVTSLAFSPSTLKAYAGTPSGVFEGSLSTFTWNAVNTGLTSTSVNSLFVNGSNIYAGTTSGVFSSPLSGISWSADGSLTNVVNALFANGSTIVAGTQDDGIFKSTIGTYSWTSANSGFNNLQSYSAAAQDSLVVVATEKGVFVCKNYFVSAVYAARNNGLTDSLHVNALAIAQGKIYAATQNAGVFVSADTGATWTSANTGLGSVITKFYAGRTKLFGATNNNTVYSTLLSSISWTNNSAGLPATFTASGVGGTGDTVFLALGANGLYANTGNGWTNTNTGLTTTSVAVNDNYVFAGTTSGVYRSQLNNFSWTQLNNGLHSTNIEAMYSANRQIIAGYKGGAQASCTDGQTWHDFNVLLYIPNYENILQFNSLSSRIFALLPDEGVLSNSFSEFPNVAPDTLTTISGSSSVCAGSEEIYSVTPSAEVLSYAWTLPNGWTGTSNTNSLSAVADSTGLISVTASNGCGTSPAKTLSVTVNAIPDVMTMIMTTTLCDNAAPLTLDNGMPSGGVFSGDGVSGNTFDPSQAGVGTHYVTYTYTSPAGCTGADSTAITVSSCTGINEISASSWEILPNPFSDELVVKTEIFADGSYIVLSDVAGKEIKRANILSNATSISTSEIENGIYLLNIVSNGKTVSTQKVVKAE